MAQDSESGEKFHLRANRSGCSSSLVPAGGILSSPNFSVGCDCNYPLQTAFSLVHMPIVTPWAGVAPMEEPLKQAKKF